MSPSAAVFGIVRAGVDHAEPGTVACGEKPGARRDFRTHCRLARGASHGTVLIRGGDPVELRVGRGQLAENLAQAAGAIAAMGGSHDAPRRVDRVEAGRERLTEIGAQLIGLEPQTPDMLFQDVLPGDAADPDPG